MFDEENGMEKLVSLVRSGYNRIRTSVGRNSLSVAVALLNVYYKIHLISIERHVRELEENNDCSFNQLILSPGFKAGTCIAH
jgi:hypothetical protein